MQYLCNGSPFCGFLTLRLVKEESELAVGCGFYLAHRDREPVVRHLGLQLLEHAIRYKWNDLSVQQKVYIKENSMQLVAEGTLDLLSEHLYVKDKVSRLVVEMMKREWPQHWPGLLEELHQLSKRGPTQTELVLFVFLRIAEDVATLQNLESNQRRRDLYQAMTANMESVFGFFLSLLEENYTQYKAHVGQQDSVTALCHCRVMQIVSRKGKADERRPLLLLFAEAPMSAVFNAADQAVMGPLSEHNYRFLKTLTQTKDSRSRAVKNVRRHGCSLMVKIARDYPDILIEAFDFINSVVDSLSHNPQELSQMEKRSEFPSDHDKAERGGFVLERSEGGAVVCRNPATPHVMPLLHQLFCLARLFNSLWHPEAITNVSVGVLWWQDSGACLKAVGVVGQVLRWLAGEGQHLSPEAVQQVMMAVLRGLHTHGQHDANQSALLSLGLATYEMFRPNFPNIKEVLIGLPGVTAEDVQSFEEKLQASNQNPNIKSSKLEKVKKDVFKKLITEIVGRNIGQAFKKEVHMNNLPPMFKAPRPKQPRVDDTDADIGLCSLFGPEVADTNGHQVT
ncbi:Exportin-5 [Portunus trituberculatus]|uniref:Exportin-5 n=1 Tax=Portunus trituberculatus TaxID=210409 RepID=A0A5B7E357_PORTR|nr:Exportin-5 [Portunus trituberculatus]